MDLKVYYQKIRQTRESLQDKDLVVVSLATGDGGKAGVFTEVPREVAAKMLVDGIAEIADPDAAAEFIRKQAEARNRVEQVAAASKVPLIVIPASEMNRILKSQDQE